MEFDRDAIEAADRLGGAVWSFLLAAAFAYMVTAAVTESFGAPLAVLSALPPALAVPALLLFASGTPMDAAVACAFVAVSGMVVNASVLTVDERRSQGSTLPARVSELYRLMRSRFGSLAATSGTTVAGALPFLFLADAGESMVRSLAFVAAAGTAASFVMALTIIPALASVAPALFHGYDLSENPCKEGRQT
jgi:multidrug efflux pump subunit AcrB